jgi:hypothetical protein
MEQKSLLECFVERIELNEPQIAIDHAVAVTDEWVKHHEGSSAY